MKKICILSTNDIVGGAAISAYRLLKGLESKACHSCKMIVRHKHSDDPNVIELGPDSSIFLKLKRFKNRKNRFDRLKALKEKHKIPWFSDNFSDVDLLNCKELRECNVINLHWTSEFAPLVDVLTAFPDKKVIVTLHDQHHFTGGCHYDLGCNKFIDKCYACPQSSMLGIADRTKQVFEERYKKYSENNFKVVGPSKWLCNLAQRSRLFKGKEVCYIPYGLNLKNWENYSKVSARNQLNLPIESFIVLSGSVNPVNYIKGGALLQQIQQLSPTVIDGNDIKHVTFGKKHDSFSDKVTQFGYVDNQKTMNLLYAAADVFCITSRYDNLPNTVLESMASGTPVIGFNIGGVPDMIEDEVTGSLVEPLDVQKFSDKIVKLLSKSIEQRSRISMKARKRIEEEYSIHKQVESYVELFQSK